MKRFLVIGAGFSGSVLANELSKSMDCTIDIMDERDHIGGNCYTERDQDTGITIHKYGPHIFNTDSEDIWNYMNNITEMVPFINRVKCTYDGNVYSLPINLHTINQFFSHTLSPDEAVNFIDSISDSTIKNPKNFEEQAIKMVGVKLYKAFFYGYTKKQWGCEPRDLPASIIRRLPVRFNYDDNYYNNKYQGIPRNGYTEIFQKLHSPKNIKVHLSSKFINGESSTNYDHVFFTGPIDQFFDYKYGKLSYRTVYFKSKTTDGDYQGCAVMNYSDESVPYTRIHEHKHFTPWESHSKSIYFMEYSKETGAGDIPYYPKRLLPDKKLLYKYRKEAETLEKISFLGRLATYRYMDMQYVIAEAIDLSKIFIESIKQGKKPPVFINKESAL